MQLKITLQNVWLFDNQINPYTTVYLKKNPWSNCSVFTIASQLDGFMPNFSLFLAVVLKLKLL